MAGRKMTQITVTLHWSEWMIIDRAYSISESANSRRDVAEDALRYMLANGHVSPLIQEAIDQNSQEIHPEYLSGYRDGLDDMWLPVGDEKSEKYRAYEEGFKDAKEGRYDGEPLE